MTLAESVELYHRVESGFFIYLVFIAAALALARFVIPTRFWRVFAGLPSPIDLYQRFSPPWPYSGVWVAVLAGGLIRLIPLQDWLWYDETFTAAIARLPDLGRVMTVTLADVHPPTNYALTWFLVKLFGDSPFVLRLPALIAGVILIWLAARLARALGFEFRAALLSAWIMALMPAAVNYSAEARQYALLACVVFATMIALLEQRRGWFVVCLALLPWIHNLGYFYVGIFGLVALYKNGLTWWKPVILGGLIGALWLPGMLYQARDVANGFWLNAPSPVGLMFPLMTMSVISQVNHGLMLMVYAPWLAVIIAALYGRRRWFLHPVGLTWLAVFAGVPLALALVSWLWRPVFLHRALLPAVLLIIPVVASRLTHPQMEGGLRRFSQYAVFAGLAVLLALVPGRNNPAGRDIARACKDSSAILNTSLSTQFLSSYHAPTLTSYITSGAKDLNQSLSNQALEALGFSYADESLYSIDLCVLELQNPMVLDTDQVAQILENYPPLAHDATKYTYNSAFTLVIHHLRWN